MNPQDSRIPDELQNRMMMRAGSTRLLRALQGKPAEPAPVQPMVAMKLRPPKRIRCYTAVSDRTAVALPSEVQGILSAVAEQFKITVHELCGNDRRGYFVRARAVAYQLIRDRVWASGLPRHSYPRIGTFFGRDHSSIVQAVSKFALYCRDYPEVREVYDRLRVQP